MTPAKPGNAFAQTVYLTLLLPEFGAGITPDGEESSRQSVNAQLLVDQESDHITPQMYFNLGTSYQFQAHGVAGVIKDTLVRLDIQDLFDTRPPLIADPAGEG